MSEQSRSYQSFQDMDEQKTVPGRKFFTFVAGKTHGAHREMVLTLQRSGQVEVDSAVDCDYLVLFCPIASRVETDINEAFSKVLPGKPIILVVMHHTFNPERVVAESRRQVRNMDVLLTVDYLFHEGEMLQCNRNDISWHEIEKVLGVPLRWPPRGVIQWIQDNKVPLGIVAGIVAGTSLALIVLATIHVL